MIWVAAAFLFPEILKRFRIPWVTAVILTGMLLGPHGLAVIHPEEAMFFLATLGLIFLMFTAGLDITFSVLRKTGKEVLLYTVLNFVVPFVAGCLVGILLELDVFASLILGTCFSSSSIGIIAPTLRELKIEPELSQR